MAALWKKKSVKIAIAAMAVLVLGIILGISGRSMQRKQAYRQHMEAAQKYLTELNYEQAIAEYTAALEIEPNAAAVIEALESAYIGWSREYAEKKEFEQAIDILRRGYEQLKSDTLMEEITRLEEQLAQYQKELAEQERARQEAEEAKKYGPELTEQEIGLLDQIADAMREMDPDRLYDLIQNNAEVLIACYLEKFAEGRASESDNGNEDNFQHTYSGFRYVYSGGQLIYVPEYEKKEGLALYDYSTINETDRMFSLYMGSFDDEMNPDGEGISYMLRISDNGWKDLTRGNWKHGKADGKLENIRIFLTPDKPPSLTKRTEYYQNGRGEGDFIYQRWNDDGSVTTYEYTVRDGHAVLDDRCTIDGDDYQIDGSNDMHPDYGYGLSFSIESLARDKENYLYGWFMRK